MFTPCGVSRPLATRSQFGLFFATKMSNKSVFEDQTDSRPYFFDEIET